MLPSWELTYPHPRYVWRWFSFPQVGYVSSMEGMSVYQLQYHLLCVIIPLGAKVPLYGFHDDDFATRLQAGVRTCPHSSLWISFPSLLLPKKLSKNDLRLTVSIIWRNDEAAKWKKNFSKTHWDHYTSQTAGDRLSTPTVERLCTRYAQRGQPVCSHLVGRCRSHKRHPCHRTSDDESGEIEEQSTGLKIREDFTWFHENYDCDMLNFYESRKSDGLRWHHVCYLLVLGVLLDD